MTDDNDEEFEDEESYDDEVDEDEEDLAETATALKVTRSAKPIKQSKHLRKNIEPEFNFSEDDSYELPSLALLSEPKRIGKPADLSDEALEQNARMLEGVLGMTSVSKAKSSRSVPALW